MYKRILVVEISSKRDFYVMDSLGCAMPLPMVKWF